MQASVNGSTCTSPRVLPGHAHHTRRASCCQTVFEKEAKVCYPKASDQRFPGTGSSVQAEQEATMPWNKRELLRQLREAVRRKLSPSEIRELERLARQYGATAKEIAEAKRGNA